MSGQGSVDLRFVDNTVVGCEVGEQSIQVLFGGACIDFEFGGEEIDEFGHASGLVEPFPYLRGDWVEAVDRAAGEIEDNDFAVDFFDAGWLFDGEFGGGFHFDSLAASFDSEENSPFWDTVSDGDDISNASVDG